MRVGWRVLGGLYSHSPIREIRAIRGQTPPYFLAKISVMLRNLSPKIPPPARFFC
jgi:hypothetical protein